MSTPTYKSKISDLRVIVSAMSELVAGSTVRLEGGRMLIWRTAYAAACDLICDIKADTGAGAGDPKYPSKTLAKLAEAAVALTAELDELDNAAKPDLSKIAEKLGVLLRTVLPAYHVAALGYPT